MAEFTLKDSTRRRMAREHRAVQIAISSIANLAFGSPHGPCGIGQYQGGVRVNGREITLRKNHANDEYNRGRDDTPEELAVVAAIHQIADVIELQGIGAIKLYKHIPCDMKDQLRSMLLDL